MFTTKCGCWIFFYLGVFHIIQNCVGIKFIDVQPQSEKEEEDKSKEVEEDKPKDVLDMSEYDISSKPNPTNKTKQARRYWLVTSGLGMEDSVKRAGDNNDEDKDEKLKSKITTLVEQTIHDTNRKISMVSSLKEELRNEPPYRAGFILSMVKKSKDVLNELFNVAVKHKNDWKALEQLKIFELIVHTNVDTTNLVRQLVEIHLQHMNSTHDENNKKRVVLLK